jgi:hypothetical protein
MRAISRSTPAILLFGLALTGCDASQDAKQHDAADPKAVRSTFRDTQDNQVVLQVHGLR